MAIDAKKTLKAIKDIFVNLEKEAEVKLEQNYLADGETIIEADQFEAGQPVFVLTEDGNVPLPIGEYELDDGRVVVVEEEGLIASVNDAPAEEETETEAAAETETEKETVLKSVYDEKVTELQTIIDDLKSKLNLSKEDLTEKETKISELEVKLSELPAGKKLGKTNSDPKPVKLSKEELSKLTKKEKIRYYLSN